MCSDEFFAFGALAVVADDVVVEDLFELGHDVVAAEGGGEFAIDVDGRDCEGFLCLGKFFFIRKVLM